MVFKIPTQQYMMKVSILQWILILLFITGCYHETKNMVSDGQISVTDFRGETLVFEKPVSRVVCLIESALSGLYMLGAADVIVGIPVDVYNTSVFNYYSELDPRIKDRSLSSPGNWDFINIESVLALQPDLVILWASQTESIAAIEARGIPVYAVMIHNFSDVHKEISDFGILTGKRERAEELFDYMDSSLVILAEHRKGIQEEKSVYFMWAQSPLETSGTNSTVNELIQLAGCRNACPFEEEHLTVNIEHIIDWNPDCILMWYNEKLDPVDVMQMPAFKNLNAVVNGQVFEIPSVFQCDFWTLKYLYAVRFLMVNVYPELSGVLNIDEAMKEMFEKFYPDLYEK
jgi:iron complex transport system substrate-binding protein